MKHVRHILREVALGPHHRETGFTRHGKPLGKPAKLQIASYERDRGFYLFYLDDDEHELTDTYHDTFSLAMDQALAEFGILPDEWAVVNVTQTFETTQKQDQIAARIRSKLSEGAARDEPPEPHPD